MRAAVDEAARLMPGLPLVAGGRMPSQPRALAPLAGVCGIAFLGFPAAHTPGKPSDDRGEHLSLVNVPMLFLQGTRDELDEVDLVRALVERAGANESVHCLAVHFSDRGHRSLVPCARPLRRNDAQVRTELLDTLAGWIDACVA